MITITMSKVWAISFTILLVLDIVADVMPIIYKRIRSASKTTRTYIRCEECVYWIDDRNDENDMGTCWLTHYFTDETDFCSYGERKDEPQMETSTNSEKNSTNGRATDGKE